MEYQLQILKEIKESKRENNADNLLKALNVEVLSIGAINNQSSIISATKNALSSEIAKLEHILVERKKAIKNLQGSSNYKSKNNELMLNTLLKLGDEIAIASSHKIPGCPSSELQSIVHRLIKGVENNETILVPRNLPSIQFLIGEGLVRVIKKEGSSLAIRLY